MFTLCNVVFYSPDTIQKLNILHEHTKTLSTGVRTGLLMRSLFLLYLLLMSSVVFMFSSLRGWTTSVRGQDSQWKSQSE